MALSNNQFKNVYNLSASRDIKKRTGVGTGVKMTAPDSPAMIKHENEAMALGNPKKSRFEKVMGKVSYALGLDAFK